MTCKHDNGQGHHNPSNPQSTTFVDCKSATGKDESFSSEAVKNGDITDIIGELTTMVGSGCNMVQGFINDMVSENRNTDAPTTVKDNNETTAASKSGKAKPVVVHENSNSNMKLADTGL